uniref:ZP domain-containing protein n=1 Tax=Knipowitschia caucasica TaxID=637954 RepID=A0AAV2KBB5_KNICA
MADAQLSRWCVLCVSLASASGRVAAAASEPTCSNLRLSSGLDPHTENLLRWGQHCSCDGSLVVLTRTLALQCGFSSNMDVSGTLHIYASLLNCFSINKRDQEFTLELQLSRSSNQVYSVSESCSYQDWASREIICHPDFMEVSVKRTLLGPAVPQTTYGGAASDPRRAAEQFQDPHSLSVLFHTPEQDQRPLQVPAVLSRGYGLGLSHSRLVLRSPLYTPETYTEQVSGVPMTVVKVSALFGTNWLTSKIDAAAACPAPAAGVLFNQTSIRWVLPSRLSPLLSSGRVSLLDVGLGVEGRRLEAQELKEHRYRLTVSEPHILVDIPIGAKGGHYKSVVRSGQYLMTYSVEPVLELLWTEDGSRDDTRYKVLFPIQTPLLDQPPRLSYDTDPSEGLFRVTIGPFAPDVVLFNISFPSETLTQEQFVYRGFRIQEHGLDPGSLKTITVHLPLGDSAVFSTTHSGLTLFSAHVTFGFLVLPELQAFALSSTLEAQLLDSGPDHGPMPGPEHGPMPGQIPGHGPMPGQIPGHGPMPGQMPGHGPMPGQMPGQGPMPGQMPGQGPMPGQMPGQGPMPGQMPGQGPMPGQMPGHGPMPGQMPGHGPMPGQMPGHGPMPGQMPGHGPMPGQIPGQMPVPVPPAPLVTGECEDQSFSILVGASSVQFQMLVGKRSLTQSLAQLYGFTENGTHFTFTVPILAPDVVYESVEASMVRARLDVTLLALENKRRLKDFSLSCSFFSTVTECFPNGTIAALALKLASVPDLDPSRLSLLDPECGPRYSTETYAFFIFSASSCGTTREFVGSTMVYRNEISLPDQEVRQKIAEGREEPEYNLRVKCLYDTNTTSALSLHIGERAIEPHAETAVGQLHVRMRMSRDQSFTDFYTDQDFPLSKNQQEALWLEVELQPVLRGRVSLELERCWVTEDQDGTTAPSWDLIINGCVVRDGWFPVRLVPVWEDSRVRFSPQLKRFQLYLSQASPQLFVHCDVTICDPRNPMDPVCSGHCSAQTSGPKVSAQEHVSSGPIFIN